MGVIDESQVFEFVVKKGNGVKGLTDSGLTSVPPRYVHPLEERIDRKKTIDASPFLGPPINLAGLEGENNGAIANALCKAATKLGFFQVVNHGVSVQVMERVKHAALTREVTRMEGLLEHDIHERRRGYAVMASRMPVHAALDYLKGANKMIYGIMGSLLRGLDVEVEDSALSLHTEAKAVNMNFYPPCPNPELTVGVGRHSDLAALTILLQDDIGGLYVKVEENGWIEIPPIEGALVINVGDTLEILSNGRHKSAEHRVIASSTQARVSVPIFVSPRPQTMIGPLSGLPEKDGKTVYKHLLFFWRVHG
ncbi:hypothetical protein HHK36_010433 [Tetracentron sinense]|uniref:Fe2OG dioxygenase domain-containing protein n=1 Tax=Tetracentron sinense TaxID=13715 RepID=A0A835DJ81_TETSI|nr:hypothetical protein HHK36_010433 [Tetracentron sinense]